MKDILINHGAENDKLINEIVAYISSAIWLIHDGAHLLPRKEHQRRSIYRKVIKTTITNLKTLKLDIDNLYLQLSQKAINFYIQDEEYKNLTGLDKSFLDEINLQKERMQMEIKESKQRQKHQQRTRGHG